jgi:Ca2+-binding RTX toxin-like protein
MTLAQIKALDLLDPATGAATNLEVPTLREALLTAKDTVMINLDMRVSQSDFDDVLQIAHDEGVLDQVVIKDNVTVAGISNVSTDISNYATSLGVDRSDINFMPIIDDGEFDTLAKVEQLFQNLMPDAVEIVINPTENDLVEDGGFLFSSAVQALAEQYDVRLWANSLFGGYSHGGQFSGERDDFLGIYDQDAVYGFWRDQGASAIQTDETRIAIDYFEANGGRPALDTHNNLYLTHGDDDVDGTSAADQIFGLQGNDNIWAHEGDDIVWGGSGNDTLVGNNGDDRIIGGDGDDWLSGNYGADTLIGDTGNDTLRGGYGDDLLTGGAGADVFLFRAVNATAHDTITDFDAGAGTGDVIKFEGGSLTSYLDVMAVAVETGSDTVITIDANRSITLQGVGTSSLHQDDFVFA